ncbi:MULTISPECIES: murein biosynthesis integral membrane protein MurJ [Rhodopseudomonas]|uniref:Probable lipid II flippase MurJ n=1 Tax=Rhodopseudomonas palustris TaxID=1076 RepID=A0A0D7EEZ8_RHOPL|nr:MULTISPECIES: murein biosynthesis integral membrane protein MurJ [Rhodopseudomonas]KIZ39201.1 membrane protein [Rhodopseudomonas palustris]WOK16823.1 murein biosynthesis integral membrane protein MurJ [Rhodopseudomonas sp. BAL398]
MIRPFLTVSAGTLLSRLLGFARDALVAALLGTGFVADGFLLAFQLVNVTRRLLTEGALNAALVPAWLRQRDANGAVAAAAFAGRLVGSIGLAMLIAALLLGVLMPWVIGALAPGFVGQPSLPLAVTDARLMLPYLAFAGPVAVLMGLLNAQGRFALTAFSPLLFNLALIGVMIALLIWRRDAADAATLIAATVGLAGLLQLSVLAMHRGERLATPLRASFDAAMRGFFAKAIPGMLANSGPQLLIVAGAIVASAAPSAVAWLYFANRLIELPLGIVGAAMGSVLVPELTRAVRGTDPGAIAKAESHALELAIGLGLPAALGLMVLSQPIVRLLFEHGAFGAADTAATAQALTLLALGLPAHVLSKALAPAFFARDNTKVPLQAMLTGLGTAIVAALLLGHWFGVAGVAAAVALGAWGSAILLIRRGATTFGFALAAATRRRLVLIVLAALAMAGLLWLKASFALPLAAQAHGAIQALALGLLIAGGIAVYGGLLVLFGVVNPSELLRAIRRPDGLRD